MTQRESALLKTPDFMRSSSLCHTLYHAVSLDVLGLKILVSTVQFRPCPPFLPGAICFCSVRSRDFRRQRQLVRHKIPDDFLRRDQAHHCTLTSHRQMMQAPLS